MTEIVMNYIQANENNFNKLRRKLIENQKIFQYVYASVLTRETISKGVDMRNNFYLKFEEWRIEKNIHKNELMDTFQSLKTCHG